MDRGRGSTKLWDAAPAQGAGAQPEPMDEELGTSRSQSGAGGGHRCGGACTWLHTPCVPLPPRQRVLLHPACCGKLAMPQGMRAALLPLRATVASRQFCGLSVDL